MEPGFTIAGWLAALAELEALATLAAYAYERPADPMPTVLDAGPCVRGDELRHPLLRPCVPNSLELDATQQVLMTSGSNMSGKSHSCGPSASTSCSPSPARRSRRAR